MAMVDEVHTQEFLRNAGSRSAVLDALCVLGDGTHVAVEMQKRNVDDHPRRVRYARPNVDTLPAERGTEFSGLPTITVAFMPCFDPFGAGRTAYHVDKVVRETGQRVDDGTLDVYVNAASRDGTKVSRLMAYIADSNGGSDEFPALAGRVGYFKESGEGRAQMGDLVEEYAQRRAEEAERGAEEARTPRIAQVVRYLAEREGITVEQTRERMELSEEEWGRHLALL